MRFFFFTIMWLVPLLHVQAQAVRLQNLMGSDYKSRTIYTEIENRLLVLPKNAARTVSCEGCTAFLTNDTLVIQPSQRGMVRFSITTDGGDQTFNYQAEIIPEFRLNLEGHTRGTIHISRFVLGQKFVIVTDGRDYWSQFKLSRFACNINNQAVVNNGPAPGREIADALLRAPRGSKVNITSIVLINKKNRRKEFIRNNQLFVVE
jgi:hypothetical protein